MYRERFQREPDILATTDPDALRRLDGIMQQMNAMLEEPGSADFQTLSVLCRQADDLILGTERLQRAA